MTTSKDISPAQRLTVIKHLGGGKGVDVVATITKLDRDTVLDIGSHHGYPDRDKLAWAADIVAKKIEQDHAPIEHPQASQIARQEHAAASAGSATPVAGATPAPLTRPDELRVLLTAAKAHPSKRIQNATNRVFDQLDKLRALIREDEQRNAAKRQEQAQKAAARAEVDRLEAQLAAARAKLRSTKSQAQRPGGESAVASGQIERARALGEAALLSNTDLEPHGLTSKDLRAWGLDQEDVDCPSSGRLPRRILDAWLTAHGHPTHIEKGNPAV